jgi:hypothetical protein
MRIIEIFTSITESQAATKKAWMVAKVITNKFGKKVVLKQFPSYLGLNYSIMKT